MGFGRTWLGSVLCFESDILPPPIDLDRQWFVSDCWTNKPNFTDAYLSQTGYVSVSSYTFIDVYDTYPTYHNIRHRMMSKRSSDLLLRFAPIDLLLIFDPQVCYHRFAPTDLLSQI